MEGQGIISWGCKSISIRHEEKGYGTEENSTEQRFATSTVVRGRSSEPLSGSKFTPSSRSLDNTVE